MNNNFNDDLFMLHVLEQDKVNDDLFMLHILEQEGEMDTRTGRLNAAAKDIIAYNALYNDSKIWEIYDKHNLGDITIKEHMYVMNKVKGC